MDRAAPERYGLIKQRDLYSKTKQLPLLLILISHHQCSHHLIHNNTVFIREQGNTFKEFPWQEIEQVNLMKFNVSNLLCSISKIKGEMYYELWALVRGQDKALKKILPSSSIEALVSSNHNAKVFSVVVLLYAFILSSQLPTQKIQKVLWLLRF